MFWLWTLGSTVHLCSCNLCPQWLENLHLNLYLWHLSAFSSMNRKNQYRFSLQLQMGALPFTIVRTDCVWWVICFVPKQNQTPWHPRMERDIYYWKYLFCELIILPTCLPQFFLWLIKWSLSTKGNAFH